MDLEDGMEAPPRPRRTNRLRDEDDQRCYCGCGCLAVTVGDVCPYCWSGDCPDGRARRKAAKSS